MKRSTAWTSLVLALMVAIAVSPAGNCCIPPAGAARGGCCSLPSVPQDPLPCSGPAQQVLLNGRRSTDNVSGIRRIYAGNVLDNRERAAIHAVITTKPGIDLAGIARELGMNRQTLRYHLNLMESLSKITALRDRGLVRYYENHGRYGTLERNLFMHLWNPTAEEILSLIRSTPGIAQSEIATHLAITPSTVRWYMRRFREDGIITERHEGRYARYALTDEAGRSMSRIGGEKPDGMAAMS
ncbi:winged helix-turn-helix transcriptional regulator [Methanoculleus palmolei]|jgi:DNA-binding transcriptional ArsR family regulator|uniref:Winged helix-turn-helix transcriptional regulator n=1 Tax=Methanoculleus palmolei TaxID=72612 RepID=A0ABD8A841_9EURY|nr:winged helix-turn-helix transcriptional regulator [Methanoculleus palmolei]